MFAAKNNRNSNVDYLEVNLKATGFTKYLHIISSPIYVKLSINKC